MVYTPAEVRALTPVRDSVEKRVVLLDPRDMFLCHAWDDRGGAAKDLHDLLVAFKARTGFGAGSSNTAAYNIRNGPPIKQIMAANAKRISRNAALL